MEICECKGLPGMYQGEVEQNGTCSACGKVVACDPAMDCKPKFVEPEPEFDPDCRTCKECPAYPDTPAPVVVTRQPTLIAYLREIGLLPDQYHIREHVTPDEVVGRDVISVLPLPLPLAARAASVTEIPLDLPRELRGIILSLDQIRQYAGKPEVYKIYRV